MAGALSARDDEQGRTARMPISLECSPALMETDGRMTLDAFSLLSFLLACSGRSIPNSFDSGVESHSLPTR